MTTIGTVVTVALCLLLSVSSYVGSRAERRTVGDSLLAALVFGGLPGVVIVGFGVHAWLT